MGAPVPVSIPGGTHGCRARALGLGRPPRGVIAGGGGAGVGVGGWGGGTHGCYSATCTPAQFSLLSDVMARYSEALSGGGAEAAATLR